MVYVCFRIGGDVEFLYVFVLLVTWGLCMFSAWWWRGGYACFIVGGNVGFMHVFVLLVTSGLCMFSCCW